MPGDRVDSARSGVVADQVWLTRDGRPVLCGASVDVPRASVTALIAPSGGGKSSLLRCVTRLLDPDRGSITLDGVEVSSLDPRVLRQRVGLVAQRATMLAGTVADNVGYGMPPGATTRSAVGEALTAAGLGPAWADRLAGELSGGEQARVAIARALVRAPDILLLDEPTAALDQESAGPLGETLRALAGQGIGIGVATHDFAFARAFADRCQHLDGSPATEVG